MHNEADSVFLEGSAQGREKQRWFDVSFVHSSSNLWQPLSTGYSPAYPRAVSTEQDSLPAHSFRPFYTSKPPTLVLYYHIYEAPVLSEFSPSHLWCFYDPYVIRTLHREPELKYTAQRS